MAIGIFKSLIFGDVNSADYGIYITGEAVYNAPERAVEMVTVPGRNGALALDQGRWENIEVSYPAGCFGDDQSDFASKIADFRNAIVSQLGYQRLTDEYNPNEYRLGTYLSGLDVKPKSMGRVGEFTITFDCKPQRYLTPGETEITVESGDTLTNPTQYESSPLLEIEGYGTIAFNGYGVELENAVMGEIRYPATPYNTKTVINGNAYNAGDDLTVQACAGVLILQSNPRYNFEEYGVSDGNANFTSTAVRTTHSIKVNTITSALAFSAGTAKTVTNVPAITISVRDTQLESYGSVTIVWRQTAEYATSANSSYFLPTTANYDVTYTTATNPISSHAEEFNLGEIVLNSTVSLLGNPTYIDCDLGECYKTDGGEYISLNGKIALGSDLPTLASGENEVTFDNTITELKIVPRWWKL